jgi:Mg-chelatase subunit ChlD
MGENNITCPGCGNQVNESLTYCDSCGMEVQRLCPHCDKKHGAEIRYCPQTGKSIGGKPVLSEALAIITTSFKTVARRFSPVSAAAVLVFMLLGAFMATYFSGHMAIPQWSINIQKIQTPRIDVVFCLDTTGSMADEIQTVKEKIKNMSRDIKGGRPSPDVRYGLVIFRDRGDEYVVKSFPFTRNIHQFSALVNNVRADGGGDTPESVNEALDVAVNKLDWDFRQSTQKLVFLIGDAGPHMDYGNGLSYTTICQAASTKGINIFAIGCSGIDSFGQSVFQQVASTTGGSFDFLTYQVAYQAPSGETHYVLNAGGRSFSVDSKAIKDDSWRRGATEMERAGSAREMSDSSASSMPGGKACLDVSRSKVSAGDAKNNLDFIMTGVIKEKAKKMGVTY